MPSNLARFKGESLKMILNDSSVSSCQSLILKFNIAGTGVKLISVLGLLNLFHGQTSWQTSQPNSQLSNLPFMLSGINASFNSIVK
jgi:hypothetical protein